MMKYLITFFVSFASAGAVALLESSVVSELAKQRRCWWLALGVAVGVTLADVVKDIFRPIHDSLVTGLTCGLCVGLVLALRDWIFARCNRGTRSAPDLMATQSIRKNYDE